MKYIIEVETIDPDFEEEYFTYEYDSFDEAFECLKSESRYCGMSAEMHFEDKEGFHTIMIIDGNVVEDII